MDSTSGKEVSEKAENLNEISAKNARISRINRYKDLFTYFGTLDGTKCQFKLDMGFDICLINKKFIENKLEECKNQFISIDRKRLVYPTREQVPINFEISCHIKLGRFSVEMSMLVADILGECILAADFFKKIGGKNF